MTEIFFFLFTFIISGFIFLIFYETGNLKESGFYSSLFFGTLIFFFLGLKGFLPLLFFLLSKILMKKEREGFSFIFSNFFLPLLFSFIWYLKRDDLYFHLFLISLGTQISSIWGIKFEKILLKLSGNFLGSIFSSFFALNFKFSIYVLTFSFLGSLINFLLSKIMKKYKEIFSAFISSSIFYIYYFLIKIK